MNKSEWIYVIKSKISNKLKLAWLFSRRGGVVCESEKNIKLFTLTTNNFTEMEGII